MAKGRTADSQPYQYKNTTPLAHAGEEKNEHANNTPAVLDKYLCLFVASYYRNYLSSKRVLYYEMMKMYLAYKYIFNIPDSFRHGISGPWCSD